MTASIDWFSYDPEDGFERHATEARATAERTLDMERDNAGDGWSECVEEICYGRVCGEVRQTSRTPADEGSEFDEMVDYGLVGVEPDTIARVAAGAGGGADQDRDHGPRG